MTLKHQAHEIYAEVLAFKDNPAVIDMIATRLERIHNDGVSSGLEQSIRLIRSGPLSSALPILEN